MPLKYKALLLLHTRATTIVSLLGFQEERGRERRLALQDCEDERRDSHHFPVLFDSGSLTSG